MNDKTIVTIWFLKLNIQSRYFHQAMNHNIGQDIERHAEWLLTDVNDCYFDELSYIKCTHTHTHTHTTIYKYRFPI